VLEHRGCREGSVARAAELDEQGAVLELRRDGRADASRVERMGEGPPQRRAHGRMLATPLLTALVVIELADAVFAVDSVPAVLAVTDDTFIAFTSNALALLGLRSLFFVLAGAVAKFRYLKVGLAGVLIFVGAKMTLAGVVQIPPVVSLAVVVALLAASILVSVARADPRAKDVLVHAGGWVVLGGGWALLVLPGPGIPLVIVGLGILGRRHEWARSAAQRIRTR